MKINFKYHFFLLIFSFFSVQADVFDVTRFDDPVPDGCLVSDCSLREAVIAANLTPSDDTIVLDTGSYDLMLSPDAMNDAETGDLDITAGTITIQGNGYWLTVIDAQYLDRVFEIVEANLILERLELIDGLVIDGQGGGILGTGGGLTLNQVKMSGHFSNTFGGAIQGFSGIDPFQLSINSSVISRNGSGSQRGAIGCIQCVVNISDSLIEFNFAESYIIDLYGSSGGIYNSTINNNYPEQNLLSVNGGNTPQLSFDVINSTFSENINETDSVLFAIFGVGSSLIQGNTFINNHSHDFGNIFLQNAVIADNIFGEKMGVVLGNVNSAGFNILSDIPNGPFTIAETDIVINDTAVLNISELQNNGGIGKTHALGAGSLARNFKTSNCDFSDQKGVSRNNPRCDVGAFQSGFCSVEASIIPDGDLNGVSNTIVIDNTLDLLNLELYIDIEHTNIGQLELELSHVESGTNTTLVNQPASGACSGDDMKLIISELDADAPVLETDCQSFKAYPQLSSKFKPVNGSLNAFIGEMLTGTWELKVIDHQTGSTGVLNQWCLYPDLEFVDLIYMNGFD
ncbi:MAG: proprotein convertase P-domain-containing protein [Xanthomonadales bacterium]|nr:proprotein convertase P-domain-containing protein [Xanthomonadales bacterium]